MPKISVIMPVYNAEKYLSEAIDSILSQTCADFEFIIIDDASTDSSPEIVRAYNDPRIRFFINETNMGVALTLNRGLGLAAGEYIARMDADDISMPKRFEMQLNYMDSHPETAVCGTGIRFIGAQTGTRIFSREHDALLVDLLFGCCFAHPSVIMRASVVGKNGLHYDPEYNKMEDYELWCRVAENHRLASISDILLSYRVHSAQVTQNYSDEYRAQMSRLKARLLKRLAIDAAADGFDGFIAGSATDASAIKCLGEIEKSNAALNIYEPALLHLSVTAYVDKLLAAQPFTKAIGTAKNCGINPISYAVRRLKNGITIRIKQKVMVIKQRSKLRCRDFTIISNNCWGGAVYQKYGLKYRTPTVGLFVTGEDFVKLCSDMNAYLSAELIFIPWETSALYERLKDEKPYPVAKLRDIEIYFMHYASKQEAKEKWERRKSRINTKRIVYKLSQRENCSKEDVTRFMNLPLENKICFCYDEIPGAIQIPELRNFSGDEQPLIEPVFDELDYLNNLT